MKAKLLTPERINYYNEQHRAIYDAILSRDVKKPTNSSRITFMGFKIIYSKPDRNPKKPGSLST
jgi:DNA-binding FadR family transcriptional regulator